MATKIKEYKIVREDYWDDGEIISTYYRIKKRNRIFGGWTYVKKEESSRTDSYLTPISFKEHPEAEKFVGKLMQGATIQGWTSYDVKTYT